jgi:hypothetical protein
MFSSVVDDVVSYGRKQQKVGMFIIKMIKEAWKLLLSSSN